MNNVTQRIGRVSPSNTQGVWAGLGVFSVAILSYLFFKQPLNTPTIIGLFMIVIGVVLVNVFKTD